MSTGFILFYSVLWLATSLHQVSPVPMTQRDCIPSDIIKLIPGSSFTLECGSHCLSSEDTSAVNYNSKFSWKKYLDLSSSDSVTHLPDTLEPFLTIDSVSHEHGGHYVCRCLPSGRECMHNVSVIPEMTFEPSQSAVHYGKTYDLTCTVKGFPPNMTTIRTKNRLELRNQVRGRLDDFTTRAFVSIMDSEEREFVCDMESYLLGSLVAKVEKTVSVVVYTPPSIIYTTEFVVQSKDDFGKPGELVCTVQTSPDASIAVAWWVNGSKIETENSAKYRSKVVPMSHTDVHQYKLTIEDVQHSDIGSYLCQLSTEYRVEDSQEAWLQVDFRKGAEHDQWQRTHEAGEYQPNNWRGGSPASGRNDILFFGVCSVAMIACLLLLWKLATGRKGRRHNTKTTPIIGSYSSNNYNHPKSHDHHTHFLKDQTVNLRRK